MTGSFPCAGNLLPEVAGQLLRAIDSVLNPKVDGAPSPVVAVRSRDSGGEAETVDPDDPLRTAPGDSR